MGMIPNGLTPALTKVCIDFLASFPGSSFASSVRTVQSQSNAMAANIVASKRRDWIVEVYKDSAPIRTLQHWVDTHPQAVSATDLAIGLLSVFEAMTDDELAEVSCHFTGEAVDVNIEHDPKKADWQNARVVWLRAKAAEIGGRLIECEGGLPKMHLQTRP